MSSPAIRETDVPVSRPQRQPRYLYPFESLKVGMFFAFPSDVSAWTAAQVVRAANDEVRKSGKRFATRTMGPARVCVRMK